MQGNVREGARRRSPRVHVHRLAPALAATAEVRVTRSFAAESRSRSL
jgi:hypothetical protein